MISYSRAGGLADAFLLLLPVEACARKDTAQPVRNEVFELGRDELRVRSRAVNKGLASTSESLNVSFTQGELKRKGASIEGRWRFPTTRVRTCDSVRLDTDPHPRLGEAA
jgi:hypothetical protein